MESNHILYLYRLFSYLEKNLKVVLGAQPPPRKGHLQQFCYHAPASYNASLRSCLLFGHISYYANNGGFFDESDYAHIAYFQLKPI